MKILFLGSLFNKSDESEILRKSKINRISNAGNIFQWNLIEGLDKNLEHPVDIINNLPVGTYPKYYEDIRLKTKKWEHTAGADDLEIGTFNLPGVKELQRAWAYRKAVASWRRKNIDEEKHIIIFSPYPPFFPALYHLPADTTVTLVVADVPLLGVTNPLPHRIIHNFIVKPLLKRIDNFVLLTEQMAVPMNVGDRRYIVLEGIADTLADAPLFNEQASSDRKIIFYAGALQNEYGIGNLIAAFMCIRNPDYELWICGSGTAENDIIAHSKKDPRIKYFGYVTNNENRKMQQQATLLINPRTNEGEFTKYSFPSKTIEYMLAGRPVLMYKLDGTPDEYDRYLYYMTCTDPEGMAARITEICEKPREELRNLGKEAQQFVLNNKNKVTQTKKIIEMLHRPTEKFGNRSLHS